MADRIGQQLGNYRLVSLLGQGGYAEVYLGQHVRLNQQAAIKVLHAHLTEQEAEHFQQEAQTIATLVHPGIVRVFDRPASDQYALGVVIYEWLCGERPFEGSVSEVMAQHLSVPPLPLHERVPEIPPEIEQVVLRALAKDPKARFASVADFAKALEQASQRAIASTAQINSEQPAFGSVDATGYNTVLVEPDRSQLQTESTLSADLPMRTFEPTVYPDSSAPHDHEIPQHGAASVTPLPGQVVAPTAAVVSPPLEPTMPVQRKTSRLPRTAAALLIGLAVLVVAGGMLGSLSLLAHFGVIGTGSSATTASPVRGGTWIEDSFFDPHSLIPQGVGGSGFGQPLYALYLPLFYGDAQGMIQPGAATEVPTPQNGGISADVKTWTFHLKPHLVWSDGQPYDARDVDYSWRLWLNPKFGGDGFSSAGLNLINSAEVSADLLSITFHLKQAYAPSSHTG